MSTDRRAQQKSLARLKHLYVHTSQGFAGILSRESQLVFGYRTDDAACEISLVLPLRAQTYSSNILPGVFRQNLPEGYLLSWMHDHFGKTMKMDDFNLLALTGADTIGRVSVSVQEKQVEPVKPEDLGSLLAWKGSESLFDHLAERYASSSGISGVQPKVLVPATVDEGAKDKDTVERGHLKDRNLIIKAGGAEYEGLAENEFHCMTIARQAGLQVPRFWISDNKELFVVERFDIDQKTGQYLGFEDMTALTGRQNQEKYDSSYENVAKAISLMASPPRKSASLAAFFKALVLSVTVGNGDAHLKNFGLLYTTPQSDDVRLSPLYDIVCTTTYIPKDTLALKLNRTKAWPTRDELVAFGKAHCQLDHPVEIIDQIVTAAIEYRPAADPGAIWADMRVEIEKRARRLQ
ncbi:hypothetical protein CAL12_25430 [Bordetella genomosp. 8]|uniref:Phosphatidylinositol kinase n=1 Tax=Bordetella genomosp. 8 TaxID=1416806 RepID=A0A1W6YTA8_9BORD|nr:type II toxin-antitoxin system HipA family toxin [Bordetella genomosp. 8]ARP83823.1 hypothetical protein CAL12_25430 [Bordetella genomosp. 8]